MIHWAQKLFSFRPSCCWPSGAQTLKLLIKLCDSDGKYTDGHLMAVETPNFAFWVWQCCSAEALQSWSANISIESSSAEQVLHRRAGCKSIPELLEFGTGWVLWSLCGSAGNAKKSHKFRQPNKNNGGKRHALSVQYKMYLMWGFQS